MKIMDGTQYLNEIKPLIEEYTTALNRDLTFQNLNNELDDLAAKYTQPNGEILVAVDEVGGAVGCVAFHRHSDTRCEMKRLYVKPEFRKMKVGKQLVDSIINLAKKAGYQEMVLDTIKPLKSAIRLYENFQFEEIAPYYDNPMDDVIYMRLKL